MSEFVDEIEGKTYRCYDIVTNTTRRFNQICTKDIKMMNYHKYVRVIQQIKKFGIETLIEYDKIYAYEEYILLEMYDYPHSLSSIDTLQYFNDTNIVDIFMSICDGNLNLHEKKLVNGNIHPNNILIENKNIKIADYCKNVLYGKDFAVSENKLAYISPEALADKGIDYKSDVWSIGCVYYYILTNNKHAYKDNTIKKTKENILNNEYRELNCPFSNLFNSLLKKMLQFIPSNRITLKELKNELEKINIEIQRQSLSQSVDGCETIEEKKKTISEYLNKIISKSHPDNNNDTSKIIEILLKMEISDLLSIINSPSELDKKIKEIIERLNVDKINPVESLLQSHPLLENAKTIEEQLDILNEYLYKKISEKHPNAARTITDMLLEFEIPEILFMIDNPPILDSRISEWLLLLNNKQKKHREDDDEDNEDNDSNGWCNCYFKYFPKNWKEDDFESLFSKYGGNVQSIKMHDDRFGYVCFETNEQAKKVIKELNGISLSFGSSKPFCIERYISKSKREGQHQQQQQKQQQSPILVPQQPLSQLILGKATTEKSQKKKLKQYLEDLLKKSNIKNVSMIVERILEMNVSDILLMIDTPGMLDDKIKELNGNDGVNGKIIQQNYYPLPYSYPMMRDVIPVYPPYMVYPRGPRGPKEIPQPPPPPLIHQGVGVVISPIKGIQPRVPTGIPPLLNLMGGSRGTMVISQPQPRKQSLSQSLITGARTVEDQKNALGEYLYQTISKTHPDKAPKITGMLLEMEVPELLLMIDTPAMLDKKIEQALNELNNNESNISLEEDLDEIDLSNPQSPKSPSNQQKQSSPKVLSSNSRNKKKKQSSKKQSKTLSKSPISNAKTEEDQKNELSEKLYYSVLEQCPEKAPQITGMLLELGVSEIVEMISNASKLKYKIKECLSKLNKR